MSSARSVSQPPSTPWGRENAVSAAHHGSPERRRLLETRRAAPRASFLLHTVPPPQLASTVPWRRALQCPSSPPSFSPAGNSTHARRALARSAMATEQRGFYRIVSADFAVCRCVHPNDRLWMDFVGHNVQSASQQ